VHVTAMPALLRPDHLGLLPQDPLHGGARLS
jgi:hypothetical protein